MWREERNSGAAEGGMGQERRTTVGYTGCHWECSQRQGNVDYAAVEGWSLVGKSRHKYWWYLYFNREGRPHQSLQERARYSVQVAGKVVDFCGGKIHLFSFDCLFFSILRKTSVLRIFAGCLNYTCERSPSLRDSSSHPPVSLGLWWPQRRSGSRGQESWSPSRVQAPSTGSLGASAFANSVFIQLSSRWASTLSIRSSWPMCQCITAY